MRTSCDSLVTEGRITRLHQHSDGTLRTWPSLHCSSSALWWIDPCPLTPPRKKREEGPLVHSKRFARPPFGDPDTTALGLQYLQQGRKKKEKKKTDWIGDPSAEVIGDRLETSGRGKGKIRRFLLFLFPLINHYRRLPTPRHPSALFNPTTKTCPDSRPEISSTTTNRCKPTLRSDPGAYLADSPTSSLPSASGRIDFIAVPNHGPVRRLGRSTSRCWPSVSFAAIAVRLRFRLGRNCSAIDSIRHRSGRHCCSCGSRSVCRHGPEWSRIFFRLPTSGQAPVPVAVRCRWRWCFFYYRSPTQAGVSSLYSLSPSQGPV